MDDPDALAVSAAGGVAVRPAEPAEYARVGALTVEAYQAAGFLGNDTGYAAELADAAARAAAADLLVAVSPGGELLGTATLIRDPASPYAELARAGEAELRMLAVSPAAQRTGTGRALVEACIALAERAGCRRLVLSSRPDMTTAHRIYARRGFRRAPELDWEPEPGFLLVGYALDLPAGPAAAQPGAAQQEAAQREEAP